MATAKTRSYGSAEYLKDDGDIAAYLEAVPEDGEPFLITYVLGVIAHPKSMSQLTRDTGLGQESLCNTLGRGQPGVRHRAQGDQSAWVAIAR